MSVPELVRLADCCEIVAGATPSTNVDSYWGGDIAWATPKDLSDLDGKYLSSTPDMLTEEGYKNCSAKLMPVGSVLFSSRAPIGHVAINSVPMCTNQGFKSFVPDPDRVSADYLYHWLKANKVYLQSLGNGATFKEVSKAVVSEIKVPLPALPEQRRIAAILDKADALRAKRRDAIAKLDQLLQSVFLEMFGVAQPDDDLHPLSELAEPTKNSFTNGPFGSDLLAEELVEVGVPVIYIRDIRDGIYARVSGSHVTPDKAEQIKACRVLPGDLLISKVGDPPGVAAVYPESEPPGVVTQDVIRLRPNKERVVSGYLCALLNSELGKRLIKPIIVEATRARFSLRDLKALEIPVPSLARQNQFAAAATAIRQQAARLEAAEIASSRCFASLQNQAFDGTL